MKELKYEISKEADIWKKILKPRWKYFCRRIEAKVGTGIPDVILTNENKQTFFVELKFSRKILSLLTLYNAIRPNQMNWCLEYPGKVFFVLYEKSSNCFFIYNKESILNFRHEILLKKEEKEESFEKNFKDFSTFTTKNYNELISFLEEESKGEE